jgi:Pretoxin HINT domain
MKRTADWLRLKVCFAAGTPLRTPAGHKFIEDFRVGDLILSRGESNPDGLVAVQVVEEVFVRTGRIWHLHVCGRVIRTTGEHPFWVKGKGWVAVRALTVGDLLSSEDGEWVAVEDVFDTGDYETVYNLRVSQYHTYFIGAVDWGFSVWAHNTYDEWLRWFGVDKNNLSTATNKRLRTFYDDFSTGARKTLGRDAYNEAFMNEVGDLIQQARIDIGKSPLALKDLAFQRAMSFESIDPVVLPVPSVTPPTNAKSRVISFIHREKPGRPIDLAELSRTKLWSHFLPN